MLIGSSIITRNNTIEQSSHISQEQSPPTNQTNKQKLINPLAPSIMQLFSFLQAAALFLAFQASATPRRHATAKTVDPKDANDAASNDTTDAATNATSVDPPIDPRAEPVVLTADLSPSTLSPPSPRQHKPETQH